MSKNAFRDRLDRDTGRANVMDTQVSIINSIRDLVMTLKGFLSAVLMLTPLAAHAGADDPLDLSGVRAILIKGDPSRITLTTRAGENYTAMITYRSVGWLRHIWSFWSYEDCGTGSQMTVHNEMLTVTVASNAASSCEVTLNANVPPDATVSIDQPATQISLAGTFRKIDLKSHAADFNFEGEATEIAAASHSLKIRINFTAIHNNETIALQSAFLEADLSFAEAKAISYRINAGASMVDSRYANTPGAKPEISVIAGKAKLTFH